jgi:hypothetical protein
MKNLYLIPTDKPSRLTLRVKTNELIHSYKVFANNGVEININQDIYITNDEEIKEGDYIFNLASKEVYPILELWAVVSYEKKIILTTDKDLIKDGVQPIDDTFLEWFVKNPTCEEIKIEKTFVTNSGLGYQEYAVLDSNFKVIEINAKIPQTSYCLGKVTILNTYEYVITYKIIIPREELNPCKDIVINDKATVDVPFHNKHIRFENLTSEQANYLSQVSEFYQLNSTRRSAVVPQEEPKQSIQEFIKQHGITEQHLIDGYKQGLQLIFENASKIPNQEGAKWQQEQDNNKYSEGDLKEAFKGGGKMSWTDIEQESQEPYYYDFKEWFEQFKK